MDGEAGRLTGAFRAWLIEVGPHVAGLVTDEPDGYRFVAIRNSFRPLDGRFFDSADEARSAALDLYREADPPRSGLTALSSL